MTETKKRSLFALSFFLFIAVVLFRQWIFAGLVPIAADLQVNFYEPWKSDIISPAVKPLGFDDVRIFYPQKLFAVSELKSGRLPLWNPYQFSGNPLLANSQTAVFYPLSLVYFIVHPLTAWSLLSLSIPLLSGFFMFLFLRKFTTFPAALFGGLAFALSGVIIVRTQDGLSPGHSALWLPLALYGIEKIKDNKKVGFLLCLISLCFSILAGWFQFSFYVLGLTLLYCLFRKVPVTLVILLFSFAILITSPHWLLAQNALRFSPRMDTSQLDLNKHMMPIYHPVTLLVQDFFGHPANNSYFGKSEYKEGMMSVGLLPLIFVLLAIFKNKDKRAKFFMATGVFSLILGLNLPGLESILSKIPIISAFLPDRIFFLTSFSICVLGAVGLDTFKRRDFKQMLTLVAGIPLIIVLACLTIYVNEKFLLTLTRFSFFEAGFERYLLIILKSTRESILILSVYSFLFLLYAKKAISGKNILLLLFLFFSIFRLISADRYLYFSNPENLFPAHPVINFLQKESKDHSRFVSIGNAKFTSNTLMFYKLYDIEGVDAMYPSWYGKLFGYVESEGKSEIVQDRISVWFSPKIEKIADWKSPYVLNLFKLTGVKTVVLKRDFPIPPPAQDFKNVFSYKDWLVFEYINPAPKAAFVGNYKNFSDSKSVLQELFNPAFDPQNEVVFENLTEKFPVRNSQGFAKLLTYNPQFLEVQSSSDKPGFIVINDNYFPNWQAKVDGFDAKVLKANYSFRAVFVPAGNHRVTMFLNYF